MMKAAFSAAIAAVVLYQTDQSVFNGRYADAIMNLARSMAHSLGI